MLASAQKAKEIFVDLIRLPSDQWQERLESACEGDDSLRLRVRSLLDAHGKQDSFLLRPADPGVATVETLPPDRIGTQIGPYKLLEQIGEGGMGLVYVAEQTQPVRRKVALKLIKPGMDTRQVIARFEAERQALAMMDHPSIARVFDAGTVGQSTKSQASSIKQIQRTKTKAPNGDSAPVSDLSSSDWDIVCDLELGPCDLTTGRPFFVMELIRGLPITEYCDQARLDPRQRLKLFIDVCHAVQHAHQKGIIHRDLKPSNVMVTLHDGTPVVKVIDFGVAKAIGAQLTDRTIYTAHAQLVGTPLYMSPEQAELSGLDVDTRSDVYSLGVLLYELLTGHTPFDKETLSKAGFDEMRRIIREDEPPRPSHRVSTLNAEAISTVSQHRGLDQRRLSQSLRGELDWIVMRALEKDRSRRYESASAVAADIQRYLSDEPVLACPPTLVYRFQKFARKHKPAFATAAAIALCLLLGTTVSAWQAVRATAAEEQANANKQQAVVNEQRAHANAAAAELKEQDAVKQRDEMKALAEKLAANEQKLQTMLYAAQIDRAQANWEQGNIRAVNSMLDLMRPKTGGVDLRSFEWQYLRRLAHGAEVPLTGLNPTPSAQYFATFTPDGKRLLTVTWLRSQESVLKAWDVLSHQELSAWKLEDCGRRVAFSPDGKRLASSSERQKLIRVWSTETGQLLVSFPGGPGLFDGQPIAFSPDGTRLLTSADGGITVIDAQSGRELFSILNAPYNITFSPDGKRLAGGVGIGAYNRVKQAYTRGAVRVWDAHTGELLSTLRGHTGEVEYLAFSPDSRRLISAAGEGPPDSSPGEVKVFDLATETELFGFGEAVDGVFHVAFSPDGRRFIVSSEDASGRTGRTRVYDSQTGQIIYTLPVWDDVVFSPDGQRLVDTHEGGLRIWDVATAEQVGALKGNVGSSLLFSPDGKSLLTIGPQGIQRFDVASKHPADWQTISLRGISRQANYSFRDAPIMFDADLKRVAGISYQAVKLFELPSGKELRTFAALPHNVSSVAISPDGKRVAAAAGGSRYGSLPSENDDPALLTVWDADTELELCTLHWPQQGIVQLAFNPAGNLLAGLANDQTVKLWEIPSGRETRTLGSPSSSRGNASNLLHHLAFSPDGKRLANGNKIWDVETGTERATLRGGLDAVAFSPDGKRVIGRGSLARRPNQVFDAETGEPLFPISGYMENAAFSPDGKRIATPSAILDAQTGQVLFRLDSRGVRVAFSADGYRLGVVSSFGYGEVVLYDATPLPENR